jgi:flagellar protein FlgJ
MDLGGIGFYQVPDLQSFSGRSRAAASSGGSFSQMLEMEKELRRQGDEVQPLSSGTKPLIDKTSKLYQTCLDLEGFLVKTLLSSMRSTVPKSGLVDEGFAGNMYEDMLYDEYAKNFTRNAGFGLADLAYLELARQQGTVIER